MSLWKTGWRGPMKMLRRVRRIRHGGIVWIISLVNGPKIEDITGKHVEEDVIDLICISILWSENASLLKVLSSVWLSDVRIGARNERVEFVIRTAEMAWNHDVVIHII